MTETDSDFPLLGLKSFSDEFLMQFKKKKKLHNFQKPPFYRKTQMILKIVSLNCF